MVGFHQKHLTKSSWSLLVVVFYLSVCGSAIAVDANLSIQAMSVDDELPVGAPLVIDIRLRNAGSMPWAYPSGALQPSHGYLSMEMRYKAGGLSLNDFVALSDEGQVDALINLEKQKLGPRAYVSSRVEKLTRPERLELYGQLLDSPDVDYVAVRLSRLLVKRAEIENNLAPGEGISATVFVLFDLATKGFVLDRPGDYEFRIHFQRNGFELITNQSSIHVYRPAGEDQRAFEIYKLLTSPKSVIGADLNESTLRRVESEYPNTAYGRYAADFLAARAARFFLRRIDEGLMIGSDMPQEVVRDVMRYCEPPQRARFLLDVVHRCALSVALAHMVRGEVETGIELLRVLAFRYPNTESGQTAKKVLSELKGVNLQ